MLYIITDNKTWTLRFYNYAMDEVHVFKLEGDLEEVLYGACAEWCENFKKVDVFDGRDHVCTMYDDGSITLVACNMPALLD